MEQVGISTTALETTPIATKFHGHNYKIGDGKN